MISAEQFIDLLESKDLVAPVLIAHLRQQVNRPDSKVSAARMAKWLVDRGHLSQMLAQRLLSQAEEAAKQKPEPPVPGPPDNPQPDADDWAELMPLEEEGPDSPGARPGPPSRGKPDQQADDWAELVPMDDEIEDLPIERVTSPRSTPAKPPKPPAPAKRPKPPAPEPKAPPDDQLLGADLERPLGAGPSDALGGDLVADAMGPPGGDAIGQPTMLPPPTRGMFGGRRKKRFGRRENVWDSPLLLIGGGTLLGLLIFGTILYWTLWRQSGDELLKMADTDYQAGSYTQAIAKYEDFIDGFPKHVNVSNARCRHGLARMRQVTDAASDWPAALEVANDVLGEIGGEEAFASIARPELVSLLPSVAEGLAHRARDRSDAALVEKASEALALVNKYVLPASRPVTRLTEIEAVLALTRREIARESKLAEAVAAMRKLAEKKETARAYQLRRDLLKEYHDLLGNAQLRETVLAVSKAELSLIEWVAKNQAPAPVSASDDVPAALSLVRRQHRAAPAGTTGHVIFATARGAVYGLDAESGKVLWRRQTGFTANARSPAYPPTPVAPAAGSDALLVLAEEDAILRVAATTGDARWRFSVDEPFDAFPVVAEDRLFVAARSGRLLSLDLATGQSPGYVRLPQELRVGPTVDFRRSALYQVAEHSNVYVLSLEDGSPRHVVYLGHEPGTITIPPVILSKYLIVVSNDGVKHSTLRVLALDAPPSEEEGAEDSSPVRVVQNMTLSGHVDRPPRVSGARMLVATDRGDLGVFEIVATDAKSPLARVAEGKASEEGERANETAAGLIRFPLFRGGQVWLADNKLTQYDLHPTKGRLQPRAVRNQRSATLQPLVSIGQTVFHVHRKVELPGVLVSAVGAGEKEPFWETHLAAPLVTEPLVEADRSRATVVTSIGAVYQFDTAAMEEASALDEPFAALKPVEVRGPVTSLVRTPDGLMVMAMGREPTHLPVIEFAQPDRSRTLFLPDPLGARPRFFAGGLLAPGSLGQVFLMDVRTGEAKSGPFQATLRGGGSAAWSDPMPLGADEYLLAEGSALYRVGFQDQPERHMAALARADLAEPIASPLAVLGESVLAVDVSESLVWFKLPGLTPQTPRPLGAKRVWGPVRVGEHVLVATDAEELFAFSANCEVAWQVSLPHGRPVGAPLEIDGSYLLATSGGVIWRLEQSTGNEQAKGDVGFPLGTGPVALGEHLLVGGYDGCVYKIKRP